MDGNADIWPHHLLPCDDFAGRYTLGKALYENGLIIVYSGIHNTTGAKCLIWELYPLPLCYRETSLGWRSTKIRPGMEKAFEQAKTYFLSQCDLLRSLRHWSFMLEYWDSFENGRNKFFLITEHPVWKSLRQKVTEEGSLNLEAMNDQIWNFLCDLDSLHAPILNCILCRDLSPDTIYIAEDGQLKLLSLSHAMAANAGFFPMVPRTPYTPVEQYTTEGQGPWSDIYAMGAVLYYCATGREPPMAAARLEGAELPPLNTPLGQAITAAMSLFPKDRLTRLIDLTV